MILYSEIRDFGEGEIENIGKREVELFSKALRKKVGVSQPVSIE